jgi:hypothetical protein
MTLKDIREHVISSGFGVTKSDIFDCYWSKGIEYAYKSDPETWGKYITKALEQVNNNDYGDFYEWDETPTPGREYYLCESLYGNDINNGIVAHWENYMLMLYFQFER